jgi:ABC-2 type transport system permease protein
MWFIKLYKTLFAMNIMQMAAYRGGVINNLIATVSWGSFVIIMMFLLTNRVTTVGGYTQAQLLVYTGVFSTIVGLFHTCFGPNFDFLVRALYEGNLETILVKPIDSQLFLSMHRLNFIAATRILVGIGFTVYMLITRAIAVTYWQVASSLLSAGVGICILYCVWLIALTLLVWFPRLSNIRELLFSVGGMSRFPRATYYLFSPVLYIAVFPILFVSEVPARLLLGIATSYEIFTQFGVAIVLFVTARIFWQRALRSYVGSGN